MFAEQEDKSERLIFTFSMISQTLLIVGYIYHQESGNKWTNEVERQLFAVTAAAAAALADKLVALVFKNQITDIGVRTGW